MLDAIAEGACLADRDGTILAANQAWKHAAYYGGAFHRLPGEILRFALGAGKRNSRLQDLLKAGFDMVCAGWKNHYHHAVQLGTPWHIGHIRIEMTAIVLSGCRYVLVRSLDITEEAELRQMKRSLSARLSHAREDERKHIFSALRRHSVRPLHGLQRSLSELEHSTDPGQVQASLTSCSTAVDLVQREVRAISFLYHPPLLGSHGLVPAIELLTRGFCHRLGLDCHIEVDGDITMSSWRASMLYRVVQEGLYNALHHDERTSVRLQLATVHGGVKLTLQDLGRPVRRRPRSADLDFTNVRECVAQIGGRLTVQSLPSGTRIVMDMPIAEPDQ